MNASKCDIVSELYALTAQEEKEEQWTALRNVKGCSLLVTFRE